MKRRGVILFLVFTFLAALAFATPWFLFGSRRITDDQIARIQIGMTEDEITDLLRRQPDARNIISLYSHITDPDCASNTTWVDRKRTVYVGFDADGHAVLVRAWQVYQIDQSPLERLKDFFTLQ